jgi:hypothetical protein
MSLIQLIGIEIFNQKIFYIEGELLHQLNRTSESKNCVVKIGSKQFKYSKIQIAFLSPIAFKHFIHQTEPFRIEIPSHLKLNDAISCFDQLDSLFHSKSELIISPDNEPFFSFLAEYLDNRFLMKKWKRGSPNQDQHFKLSSKQIIYFPKSWLNHLTDFDLTINNQVIALNFSLFSCVCQKFQELHYQENQIGISISDENFHCFLSFFDMMKGYSFSFDKFDYSSLKNLINYFGINSLFKVISSKIPIPQTLKSSLHFISQPYCEFLETHFNQSISIIIQNFNSISVEELSKISNSHLLKLFSAESLQIENEDYFFKMVLKMIQEDKNLVILM